MRWGRSALGPRSLLDQQSDARIDLETTEFQNLRPMPSICNSGPNHLGCVGGVAGMSAENLRTSSRTAANLKQSNRPRAVAPCDFKLLLGYGLRKMLFEPIGAGDQRRVLARIPRGAVVGLVHGDVNTPKAGLPLLELAPGRVQKDRSRLPSLETRLRMSSNLMTRAIGGDRQSVKRLLPFRIRAERTMELLWTSIV